MSLRKEFAPYQESFELKELGFDKPCFGNWQDMKEETPWFSKSYADNQNQYYGQLCSAPTFSQAFDFFREKYNIQSWIPSKIDPVGFVYEYMFCIHQEESSVENYNGFETYEEAELACLRKLIEITKKSQDI